MSERRRRVTSIPSFFSTVLLGWGIKCIPCNERQYKGEGGAS